MTTKLKLANPLKRLAATAAIAVVLTTGTTRVHATEGTATARATAMFLGTIALKGYSGISREDSDVLGQGQSFRYPITLYRGRQYALFAAGDDSIEDLDIYVYDEAGNLVVSDKSTDNLPWVYIAPAWTGLYYLVIENYRGDRGWYHMAIAY